MFLKGLMNGGVPIKFATWNRFSSSIGGGNSANIQIQERSRSVKSIFTLQRRDPTTYTTDSGASFFSTGSTSTTAINNILTGAGCSTLQEYQYRIGGRYFPAAPVQNATTVGGSVSNGGAESWIELSKALNTMGDSRLAVPCNVLKWAIPPIAIDAFSVSSPFQTLPESDYRFTVVRWQNGSPACIGVEGYNSDGNGTSPNAFSGNLGSSCFAMAIDLETSNGGEISGLNAEEQSDISFIARWNVPQATGFIFDTFTFIDSMIVLRENNVSILLIIGIGTDSVISIKLGLLSLIFIKE